MTLHVIKFYNIKTLLSVLEDVTLFQCIPFLNLLPPGINVSLDIVYSDLGGGGVWILKYSVATRLLIDVIF